MHKIAGVLGWPVNHSLSPKLHNYWLNKHGIDGEYTAWAVEPHDLSLSLKSLPQKGWQGCNLTLPHKEPALEIMDSLDETARAIGAVNTVVVRRGKLHGTNTDAHGFIENIRPHLKHKGKAVILGAGGAARAVCYALFQEGFSDVIVTNRTHNKAVEMVRQLGGKVAVHQWTDRSALLKDADLLVNTTSLGMVNKDPVVIDLSLLPGRALVTDIVYTPLMTPLLVQAKACGNPVIDGLGMLLHQAVPGFEAWFGIRPEVTPDVRQHVLGEAA